MDPTNYAGIKGKTPEESNDNSDTQEDDDDEKENDETVSHLGIGRRIIIRESNSKFN